MQSAHGDGHIGNTLSVSSSAYQGTAVIHLLRRPLCALGCGPEAMVLVEQNSNESTFAAGFARQIALDFASFVHARVGVLIFNSAQARVRL